jgi:hypothetical protein
VSVFHQYTPLACSSTRVHERRRVVNRRARVELRAPLDEAGGQVQRMSLLLSVSELFVYLSFYVVTAAGIYQNRSQDRSVRACARTCRRSCRM